MATLIDNYEQQYAVLTADITAKICRISVTNGGIYYKSAKLFLFINMTIILSTKLSINPNKSYFTTINKHMTSYRY